MFKLIRWNPDLDLSDFYRRAAAKGFENNANQQIMIDSLSKEDRWAAWILYYNDLAVGAVAAHSFPEMGENSFRICARTCVLSDDLPLHHLRTKWGIIRHQNYTAQFFIPACVEWAGRDKDLYITSNESKSGSQRLVHEIFCPLLAKSGVLSKTKDIYYRGLTQTAWRLDVELFFKQLDQFGRWVL